MASNTDASDQARQSIHRREILRRAGMLGAGGSIVSVAGCAGDETDTPGSGNGDENGDENGGQNGDDQTTVAEEFTPADNAFANATTDDLTNYHFNHLHLSQGFHHPMMFEYLQRYHIPTGDYEEWGLQFDEWAPDEERVVLKVMDGLTWHNGDPVTGEDLKAKFVTLDLNGAGVSNHFIDLEVADDQRLELTLNGSLNRDIFQQSLNNLWIDTPARLYGKYVDMWEDASSNDELIEARNQMQNEEIDEPFGNGLFQFEEVTTNRLRMSLYEDHPHSDRINFDYWDVRRVSTDPASVVLGMVPDGPTDMNRNYTPPEAVLNQAQNKDGILTQQLPALWGLSIPFNNDHEYLGRVRVRQALAEFIDRGLAARNYGRFGQPVEAPAGLVGNIARDNSASNRWQNWVSDEAAGALHRYRDPDRGARLLREEGFELSNGNWLTPDGDLFEVPITTPSDYTDWNPVYRAAVSSLQSNGITASLDMVDSTAYWGNRYLQGDYVAASTGWTLQNPHPYYTNNMYWNVDNQFMNIDMSDGTVQAPPFGEPDGDLQEWNVQELMADLRVAGPEEQTEYVDQLAWVVNQNLPMLPVTEINDVLWMTDDDWYWEPDLDDPVWQAKWPQWWFPRKGLMGARDEDDAR